MVIVTGAAGFIGSQIASHVGLNKQPLLLTDKQKILSETRYLSGPLSQAQTLAADGDFLARLPTLKNVSWIIHMGAITNTAETDLEALKKWNVDYTKALWKYCSEFKVNLIYASSAATYGDGTQGFSDDHGQIPKLKPLNPYGRSKHEFDLFTLSQTQTPPHWYGLKFFNVYGPHEDHKGRMASAVWHGYHEIKKTGAMTLFKSHNPQVKDGDQARDFIYVGDVLKVIDFLQKKTPANGIYNCGTGRASTFMELANGLFGALRMEPQIHWVETPEEFRAAYQYRTVAAMGKLNAVGYSESFTSLKEGIKKYAGYLNSAP